MKKFLYVILAAVLTFNTWMAIKTWQDRNKPIRFGITHIFAALDIANNFSALQQFSGGVSADGTHAETIPSRTQTLLDTISIGTCGASNWIKAIFSSAGPTCTQPAASDLSNGVTGSGAVVLATSPALTAPSIGGSTVTRLQTASVAIPSTAGFTFSTVTITWPASFGDTNYFPWCLASDSMALGAMTVNGIASRSATQMTIGYNNNTGGAQTGTMFCGALHP